MLRDRKASKKTGLGLGRPVKGGGPLADVGNLPGGGVQVQVGNACGTCSLSAVLRHFGVETTQKEIDLEIRNLNIFTAPDLMLKYARSRGFEAVFRNNGTAEEVKGFIDRGAPVILLVDTRPGNMFRPLHLHYVTAISCRQDVADGFRLGIYNPWGLREEISGDELANAWADVHIGPFECWDRAFIAVAPAGTGLGGSRRSGSRGANMLGLSIANTLNGVVHILRDLRPVKGALELAAAWPQSFVGLSLFLLEQLALLRSRARTGY